jgi:uncharacterized protein (TIGR02246 family)
VLKRIGIALFGLIAATGGGGPARAAQVDESAIRSSLDRLAQAWNAPDASAWAQEYWPDGELTNILGLVYVTPADIRDRTAEILAGPFRGSHYAYTVRRIRLIGTDAALVDTDITVTGFRGLPGIAPTRPAELVTRMKHVYQRRHGKWLILSSQNTAVVSAPAPP